MHPVLQVAAALIPSIGVGAIFWYAVRLMIQADRRERLAMARLDAEEARREAGNTASSTPSQPGPGRAETI